MAVGSSLLAEVEDLLAPAALAAGLEGFTGSEFEDASIACDEFVLRRFWDFLFLTHKVTSFSRSSS